MAGLEIARRHQPRRVLGVDLDSDRASLLWASPFMLFLAIPLVMGVREGIATPLGFAIVAITVTFAVVYVCMWLFNPVAPTGRRLTTRLAAFTGMLVSLQIAMALTGYAIARDSQADSDGMSMMMTYPIAAWMLLSPRPLLWPGFAIMVTTALAQGILIPGESFVYGIFAGLTASVTYLARSSIESDREKEIAHRQSVVFAEERERTRIAGDLHDILGHTLTGITVKADLAGRLLDAGRTEDARAQIDDLTEMSREALADVRGVVAHNKTLDTDTELASARDVLEAAGATLDVMREGFAAPGEASTLIAHVIRESVTNALLHARPDRVRIVLRPSGVTIANDGHTPRMSRGTAGGGTGLPGLRERVADRGTLTWGPTGAGWWEVGLDLRSAGPAAHATQEEPRG